MIFTIIILFFSLFGLIFIVFLIMQMIEDSKAAFREEMKKAERRMDRNDTLL